MTVIGREDRIVEGKVFTGLSDVYRAIGRRHSEDDSGRKPELILSGSVILLVAGLSFGLYQLMITSVVFEGQSELSLWNSRLSIFSGILGALSVLASWPIIAAIVAGTFIVLWNVEIEFNEVLHLVGLAAVPILLQKGFIYIYLLFIQPEVLVTFVGRNAASPILTGVPAIIPLSSQVAFGMSILLLAYLLSQHFRLGYTKAFFAVLSPIAIFLLFSALI